MKNLMRKIRMVLFLGAAIVLAACGGGDGGGGGGNPGPDTTPPTGAASPVTGSPINGTAQIHITFSESMDTASLVVGGTLASEAAAAVWSETTNTNDTITIAPTGAWSSGNGRTLTIDGADLAGNPLTQMVLAYDVDNTAPTAFVSPPTASTISKSAQIVVSFSESMNPASLALSGLMSAESDSGVWTNTTSTNDTLTIGPSGTWTGGSSRTLTVNAEDRAGNAVSAINLSYTVDTTLGSATVSPLNGSALATDNAIVITFSKSMNPATLSLGGVLSGEAGTQTWSTAALTNDTLTIHPATLWTVGESRSLSVDADDSLGNPISTLNLAYDTGVLYVSSTGTDTNSGSRSAPLKTISTALAASGYPEIHVCVGTFNETVSITDGRTIKGSYDPTWTTANVTVTPTHIQGAASGALVIQNVAAPVAIANLEVDGANATSPSESTYAIRVTDSSGPVSLQSLLVVGGTAGNGQNGSVGTSVYGYAATGSVGGDAYSASYFCNSSGHGAGGAGAGSGNAAGGTGGSGGTMDTSCPGFPSNNYDATAGAKGGHAVVFAMNGDGDGGAGGAGVTSCGPGGTGNNGRNGQGGTNGISGQRGTVVSGFWSPVSGGTGGPGTDGNGGGGGGGSGGCDTGTDSWGAGGGGGGAGGAPATVGGTGGGGGGASFGILINNSTVNIGSTTVYLGQGGNGGVGGAGGTGQYGGSGGQGGAAAGGSGPGGAGGRGGNGGNSGSGGGGAGGDVYGIYQSSSSVTLPTVIFSGGTAGTGGYGGGGSSINKGLNGILQNFN